MAPSLGNCTGTKNELIDSFQSNRRILMAEQLQVSQVLAVAQ